MAKTGRELDLVPSLMESNKMIFSWKGITDPQRGLSDCKSERATVGNRGKSERAIVASFLGWFNSLPSSA
jgi:hypothetical protein